MTQRRVNREQARRRSRRRGWIETLEPRRVLASGLGMELDSVQTGNPQQDVETDPQALRFFHGPRMPGRPIAPVQAVTPLQSEPIDEAHEDHDDPDSDFPAGSDAGDDETIAEGPFSNDQTFLLHSRPGANHTIYLDFDGHTSSGTSWNSFYNESTIVHPNYWGGSGNNFSDSQLTLIQQIWQVVAEDFAPFEVNVTTEEPADVNDLIYNGSGDTRWGARAVMTTDSFSKCGCGGQAFIGAFDDRTDEAAFIYNRGLAIGSETVSHEVGHLLGLHHDGQGSTTYYNGHGSGSTSWGPILGGALSRQVTQWNNGDYYNASETEDDLSLIVSANNFPYLADDHSNTRTGATQLDESGGTSATQFGIIERNTDVDWFQFSTSLATVSIDVDALAYKPNLDLWAGLYDDQGNFIAEANPSNALNAPFADLNLAAGQYFIRVQGVARNITYAPATDTFSEPSPTPYSQSSPQGYSGYGSLGQYEVKIAGIAASNPTVSITATNATVWEGADAVFTISSSDGGNTDVTIEIAAVRQQTPGQSAPFSASGADFSSPVGQVVSLSQGTAAVHLTSLKDALNERTESFAVRIVSATGYEVADRVAYGELLEGSVFFEIDAESTSLNEGDFESGGTATLTITRSGTTTLAQDIDWEISFPTNDAADANDLNSDLTGTVSFAANQTTASFDVPIEGDLVVEGNETFLVSLLPSSNGNYEIIANQGSASIVIVEDESIINTDVGASLRLRQVAFSSANGDNWAFDDFVVTSTDVSDDFDPNLDQTKWASIESGIASGIFPESQGNALFFNAGGERFAETIPLRPAPGATADFSIIFASRNGGGMKGTSAGEDVVLEYSIDAQPWTQIARYDESDYTTWTNVSQPLPAVLTQLSSITEGNAATETRTLEINRTGFIDKASTFTWSISPTGANPASASDFVGGYPSGTATFAAGQSAVDLQISLAGDTVAEADETFLLTFTSHHGGPTPDRSLQYIIHNDDTPAPNIEVRGGPATVIANGDLTADVNDGTDFGLVAVGSESPSRTYQVHNTGDRALNVTDIQIGGDHANRFAIAGTAPQTIQPNESYSFDVRFVTDTAGLSNAEIIIHSDDSAQSPYRFAVTATATDLLVESIVINNGAQTRSQLDEILVTFNQPIDGSQLGSAVRLRHLEETLPIGWQAQLQTVDGKSLLTIFPRLTPPEGNQPLPDGNYELRIIADFIRSSGADNYPMLADYTLGTAQGALAANDGFFRLLGDSNGDRDVNGIDLGLFAQSYQQPVGTQRYDHRLDLDGNDAIDGLDYALFLNLLGNQL